MPIERYDTKDRQNWLALRRNYINASEIGTLLGISPYGSRATLFAEKKGVRPPQENSDWLRRRRWGEAAVFEALTDERPEWEVARASVYLADSERKIGATPDGFAKRPDIPGPGVIQAKTVARSVFRKRWLHDPEEAVEYGEATPPAHYLLQTLMECMLSECDWGVLAVLIEGEFDRWLRLFEVERDSLAEDNIIETVAAFYRDHLDPGIMPEFDPTHDEPLIKTLFPRDHGSTIDLSGDNRAMTLVNDLSKTHEALHYLKKEEKEIKTELASKLGDHTYGRLGDGRVVCWQTTKRRAYTVKATEYRVLKVIKDKLHTNEDE
jgi:predicted phage-related endonuclease